MKSEYGVEYIKRDLPFQYIQRIKEFNGDLAKLNLASDTRRVTDVRGKSYLLFTGQWSIKWALDKNPSLVLEDFDRQ